MEALTRHSRFASLLMLGLLLGMPLIQPSTAGLLLSPAEKGCCGSCGHDALFPAVAESSARPDHTGTECDICPSNVRCSSGASVLLPHPHRLTPVPVQTAHFASRLNDPVTHLYDGSLFRPPRPDDARTG
ncbi:MAG: hypothetical protein LBN96_08860 [Desulfovibrio sp.]|jgi:hypothetical protein|nr:hypothetical protein [Desulfovibrio sp.]